jgi:hypothetical protein
LIVRAAPLLTAVYALKALEILGLVGLLATRLLRYRGRRPPDVVFDRARRLQARYSGSLIRGAADVAIALAG